MKNPRFLKEPDTFYSDLRAEVDAYFERNSLSFRANNAMLIKIAIMFLIYLAMYGGIYLTGQNKLFLFGMYALIGGWSVILGLNIGHDAAHNAIFQKRSHNQFLLYVFEMVGTNAYNWKNRHIGAHHTFPNVMDHDSDIQQTNFVKIFPKDEHKTWHAFQHLYMPLLYLFYIFRWVIYRDFKDARSKHIGAFDNSDYPKKELLKMIFFKAFYLFYMILLPFLFLPFSLPVLIAAFFVLTVAGSLVITMVLLSTHVGEDANFPEPDEHGFLPHSWSHHQVITAADFGTGSWLINWLFGGFNHHVIHHLFPHVCHVHYPELTPLLKAAAEKHGLPYRHKKYLLGAMLSHFRLLNRNGRMQFQS